MTRTKVLIVMGIAPLIAVVLLSFTFAGQPVAAANVALGNTLTPTNTPLPTATHTAIPPTPTDTPVPAPTDTPAPPPPTSRPSSKPAATAVPTATPIPILPLSGGANTQTGAIWMLGITGLLCGMLLFGWSRSRRARGT